MPTRRGPSHVGLPRVADEDNLCRLDAQGRNRHVVDIGMRLARAGPGRGDTGVDQPQQAGLVEERIELPAPVRAHADGQPRVAQQGQRRDRLGVRHHLPLVDVPQGVDQVLDVLISHTAGDGEVMEAGPNPGLVGLLADRMLAVLDPVVAR